MTEKWVHSGLLYSDGMRVWFCLVFDAEGMRIGAVEGESKEKCLERANLICATPDMKERIEALKATIREATGLLDQAYDARYDLASPEMCDLIAGKFIRVAKATQLLRGVNCG